MGPATKATWEGQITGVLQDGLRLISHLVPPLASRHTRTQIERVKGRSLFLQLQSKLHQKLFYNQLHHQNGLIMDEIVHRV